MLFRSAASAGCHNSERPKPAAAVNSSIGDSGSGTGAQTATYAVRSGCSRANATASAHASSIHDTREVLAFRHELEVVMGRWLIAEGINCGRGLRAEAGYGRSGLMAEGKGGKH